MKNILGRLPNWLFALLKIVQYKIEILTGKFVTDEPEFYMLDKWVKPNTVAIDIGANHGVYTREMARFAKYTFSIEPVDVNYKILRSVASGRDVFLYKVAATDKGCKLKIDVPVINGYSNLYQSRVSDKGQDCIGVRVDGLPIPLPVSLIKIDAEGHDYQALKGCEGILDKDHPTIIIETDDSLVNELLSNKGYRKVTYDNSPNTVYFYGWS